MNLKATIEATSFKNIIFTISKILEEGTFFISPNGFHLRAMDPSHISMLDCVIPMEIFEEFEFESENEKEEIGLDFADLFKFLNGCSPGETLRLEIDSNNLLLTFFTTDSEMSRNFSTGYIVPLDSCTYKIPKISFDAKFMTAATVFKKSIKDALLVENNISISLSEKCLHISSCDNMEKMETMLPVTELQEYSLNSENGKVSSTYSASYLEIFAHANEITVNFGEDMPAKFQFAVNGASIIYVLAPKVER